MKKYKKRTMKGAVVNYNTDTGLGLVVDRVGQRHLFSLLAWHADLLPEQGLTVELVETTDDGLHLYSFEQPTESISTKMTRWLVQAKRKINTAFQSTATAS